PLRNDACSQPYGVERKSHAVPESLRTKHTSGSPSRIRRQSRRIPGKISCAAGDPTRKVTCCPTNGTEIYATAAITRLRRRTKRRDATRKRQWPIEYVPRSPTNFHIPSGWINVIRRVIFHVAER